jgi:hypothetical protein
MVEVDHIEVVREMWPTIGPHTPESLGEAAIAYHEIVRVLAHATLFAGAARKALPTVPDGYVVLGHLAEAASSEQQALDQLANWAEGFAEDPTIRHTDRPASDLSIQQAQVGVLEAAEDLRKAARHAAALAQALRRAQVHTSPIYHDDEEENR